MRLRPTLPRRAFTLIELLTVIAIIGILAGMIIGVTQAVKNKARIAASKKNFSEWCTGVEQYKATYGSYPYLGGAYKTNSDTLVKLNSAATVTEFIKCMTGRQPIYDNADPLSPSDRTKYNRQTKEFCSFDKMAFEMNNGAYTKLLCDSFGNTNIALVMDTDGNGMVNPSKAGEAGKMPDESTDTQGNVANRVIIYTLKATASTPGEGQDILSWQ